MTLDALQLTEPIVTAMVALLNANLNSTIDQLNATITDGYTIDHAAQILPYVPVPSTLEGGMPAIGVQRLGGQFEDDLQSSMDAAHRYAIVAVIQNADHRALTLQLERTLEAIAYTVQQDRVQQPGVMRAQGGCWSVNFIDYQPGPLLGDVDPQTPESPPRSYLSWTAITFESRRSEV